MENNLREIRWDLRISQLELSKRCGVNRVLISQLEKQKPMNVSKETIIKLMKGTGKTAGEIFPDLNVV